MQSLLHIGILLGHIALLVSTATTISLSEMVDLLIGHHTYRMFPPAIDIIPTSLAVAYSNGKYTN